MKSIRIAVFSFLAGLIHCANAGDLSELVHLEGEFHLGSPALGTGRPMLFEADSVWFESSDPARLRLSCWALAGTDADPLSAFLVALYSEYGSHSEQGALSPSRAKTVTAPFVRSIEVNYPDATEQAKADVLKTIRTRVGKRYSERVAEEDIRRLSSRIADLKRVRIFCVACADGVRVIVALQPNSGFDFNIGYEF
jgi:hypothetical protein